MIKQQAQTQPEGFYSAREIPAEYTLNYYVKASEDRVRKVQRGICLDKVVDDNCKQYSQTEMARRQYPTLFDDVSSPTLSVREYQTMRSFNPTTEHQKHDQLRTFFKEKYRAINHFIDGDEIDAYKERKQKRQAKQVAMRAKREATRKPKDLLTRLNDLIISEVTNEVDQQKQEEQDAKRLALEKELMSKKLVVFSSPRRKKIQLAPAVKHKQYWKTPNLKKSVRLWKVDLNTQNPGLIQQYPKPPNSAEDRQLGLLFGSTKQATQSTKKLSSTASARHVLMSRPQTQQSICDNQKMSRAMTALVTDGVKRKRQFFNAFQPSLDIQNVVRSSLNINL